MTATAPLAQKPATQGLVRMLEQQRLISEQMYHRFLTSGDAEALHDLRVSLRRLRAIFSGFSSYFSSEDIPSERLRLLQQNTNKARDLEVMLALVEQWHLPLSGPQELWQKELAKEYRKLQQQLPTHWSELSLAMQTPEQLLEKTTSPYSLGIITAANESKAASKLLAAMKSQTKRWKKRRAHKLRIRGKRLRYLIEPFSDESPEAAEAVTQLKQLQTLLGDYHDILVLRQKIKMAIEDHCLSQDDRPKRAHRLLKKRARRLRKRFLQLYDGKARQSLRKSLRHTSKALAQR